MAGILSYFLEKKNVERKKESNEFFDAKKENNSNDALYRAERSILILKQKIENLIEDLKITKNDINKKIISEHEQKTKYIEISGQIQVINQYIKTLQDLARNIVNNPKYRLTPKGNFLNLHFLSILNNMSSLTFNSNLAKDERYEQEKLNRLIVELNRSKDLLDRIKFQE